MAGKDLYIQPIIDNSLSSLQSNIESMNTQLSETTRILMNILNNQGLEQHQEAYGGATFSALTISTDNTPSYNFTFTRTYPAGNVTIGTPTGTNSIDLSGGGSYCDMEFISGSACNFIGVTEIVVSQSKHGGDMITIVVTDEDDTETTISGNTSDGDNKIFTFSIATENRKNYKKVKFCNITKYGGSTVVINYTGGTFAFEEFAHLAFNANNILTWETSSSALAVYDESKTAYITIPDIQGVATWVSTILKGNLDGVSVALVDNTTHDLIKVLPTATSDISDVNELSGLALMVTFAGDGNALKFMSGFSMRYY